MATGPAGRAADLLSKSIKSAAAVATLSIVGSAWYHRPLPDPTSDDSLGPDRSSTSTCSNSNPPDDAVSSPPPLIGAARRASIGVTTAATRAFMYGAGTFDVRDDAHYRNFVRLVSECAQNVDANRSSTTVASASSIRSRDDDEDDGDDDDASPPRGLLTVSNHRSLFDDPGVMACLLPFSLSIDPKYNRWAVCSQEYCFHPSLPTLVHGYIGAGQVLPIWRGGGIDQKLLLDLARHLAAGEWVHLFPEGGVWQDDELGGRNCIPTDADFRKPHKHGRLKWGCGKLIAHAPQPPAVIPFVHHGMENLLPMDRVRRTVSPKVPWRDPFHHVTVMFGPEIRFDDLIEEHERVHGKLWTYGPRATKEELESPGGYLDNWRSSDEERVLYAKITKRIEEHLRELNKATLAEREVQMKAVEVLE